MELKKPANSWDIPPGTPNPQAAQALASAIRIDVAIGPETAPDKAPPSIDIAPKRLPAPSTARAQTPLPTRKRFSPDRQFLGT